jgi:hypothetical protein
MTIERLAANDELVACQTIVGPEDLMGSNVC